MKNIKQIPTTPQGILPESAIAPMYSNHESPGLGNVEERIRLLGKTAIVAGVIITLMTGIVGIVSFHQVWAGFPIGMALGLTSFYLLIKTTPNLQKPDYREVGLSVFISFTKLAGLIFCIWLASQMGINVPQILGGILLSQVAVMISFVTTSAPSKSSSRADEYARS